MRFFAFVAASIVACSPAFAADPAHAGDDVVASAATLPAAAASSAVVDAEAESPADGASGTSYGVSLGSVTSNPWRGDQLGTGNAEGFWTSSVGVGFGAGPGTFGVGFTALGPYSGGYADFSVPVTYAVETGAVTTTAVYEPMPTTYTAAPDVIHEVGADVEVATGPVTPSVGFRVDPTVGQGVYANAGLGWEQSVGRVSFGAGTTFGVTAYQGASFGAQHVDAGVGTGFDLGAGFGAGVDASVSYGFRSGDVIPFGGLSLSYER